MSVTSKQVCLITALIALLIYLYGILITITTIEKNSCKMTYMYEYPQFVKVHFRENEKFPRYNLYAYSEGRLTEAARNMKFNGAPVIFVPGNGGSYKQARSFASVALRKGIDENWLEHLDYFTVDFDEEFSALFGGVLDDQSIYLELCIKAVLNLYKDIPNGPTSVVIIAHSMGGKIAQSVLANRETANLVNTVIAIAAPIDTAVLNIDFYTEAFYRKTNKLWLEHRLPNRNPITNLTNTCCNASNNIEPTSGNDNTISVDANDKRYFLKDILFITIGGGSRDLLVHSGLTASKFSDIHTMSTCMPNVWLTTDHLSSIWCLQQVLVINRFLFSIIQPSSTKQRTLGNKFINDKALRLASAKYYLTQDIIQPKNTHDVKLITNQNDIGEWVEDIRRVFFVQFKNGLNRTYVQMIRLNRLEHYQFLDVEGINVETDDWMFGCNAVEFKENQRYCSRGRSLTHYVHKLPSRRYNRKVLTLDLYKIQDDFPEWTHVLLFLQPTKEPVQLNIDIHSVNERQITYQMPSWYSYTTEIIAGDTVMGAGRYRLNVVGLDESYQAIEIQLNAQCSKARYHTVAKVCVPWTRGFERFHYFTEEDKAPLYVYTPITRPAGYNTSLYPITVDLYLDPECRYNITAKNSFGQSVSRIFLQFSHWIPAHMVAILLLAFRYQIKITPEKEIFRCGSLNTAYLAGQTFFIITASRLAVHVIAWSKTLPDPDHFKHSVIISVVIHGSALALLNLLTYGLWVAIALCGNVAYQFLFKLASWPVSAGMILPALQKFPITIGFLLVSMAHASCSGLALICAVIMYFILLSKMYEDYLEEFVFKTAAIIAEKLFGKKRDTANPQRTTNENTAASAITGSDVASTVTNNDAVASVRKRKTENSAQEIENKDKHVKSDQNDINVGASTSKAISAQQKGDLNQPDDNESAIVASESENSFEVLYNQLDPEDVAQFSDLPESEELDEETRKEMELKEAEVDAELEKLIQQMTERQKIVDAKQNEERLAARVEYDDVPDGLSAIHFHMTIFLLLCVLALLNLPSVFVWARNYKYGEKILQHDPSYFPAITSIVSLSIIWQLPTPRNIHGYDSMSSLCYVMAIICILYCQDSLYRLNAIIASMFIIIALQQLFMPKMLVKNEPKDDNIIDTDLLDRVRRLREDMAASELRAPPDNDQNHSIADDK